MNITERYPTLTTIAVILFVFVVAAIPVSYEDMQLYDGPIRIWDIVIPIGLLLAIAYNTYTVQEKEINE